MKRFLINLVAPLLELSLAVFFCIITFNDAATKTTIHTNNLNTEKIITDSSLIALERIVSDGTNIILSPIKEEGVEEKLPIITEQKIEKEEVVEEKKIEISEDKPDTSNADESMPVVNDPIVNYDVLETYIGTLTGYGNDCRGCGSLTAADYDISNTIYYDDPEFGRVRIVAAGTVKKDDSTKLPFYSIVRINNIPNTDPIIAIVLDRGGSVGYGKVTLFDLLFESENVANNTIGKIKNISFDLLRRGK